MNCNPSFNGRCYDLNLSLNAASYVLPTVTIYSGIVLSWLLAILSAALLKIMISKWTDIPVFITFAFFIVPLILIIAAYITIFITARKSFQGQRKMSLKRVIMELVCASFSVWEISRVLMLTRSLTHFDARCVKFHAFRNTREVTVCPKNWFWICLLDSSCFMGNSRIHWASERLCYACEVFDIHTEVTFGKVGRRTLFGTWFDKKFGLLFCKEIQFRIIPGNPGFIVLASPPSDHTPCSLVIYSEFQICVYTDKSWYHVASLATPGRPPILGSASRIPAFKKSFSSVR